MSTADFPLEPDAATLRQWTEAALERVIAHLESLPEQPAFVDEGGEAVAAPLKRMPSDAARTIDETLAPIFDAALHSFNTAHPGYFAYVPGGGVYPAAIADLIANALNRYVGVWIAAPGLAQLEQNVIDWMLSLVGFTKNSGARPGGVLVSGGSLANFSAMIAARKAKAPEDLRKATVYVSHEVHHSMSKAAMLAGIPPENVRAIAVDDQFRMKTGELRRALEADRTEGMVPALICASAGTTNTGAIDPLRDVHSLCKAHDAWMHVDAAYGGFFLLTERGKKAFAGIELADSVTLDPHKGLFLPYGTGALLVRDRETLRDGHAVGAAYLPTMLDAEADGVDFCELSPELSRDFRGLRVWLSLELFGVDAFRDALDEKMDLARGLSQKLAVMEGVDVVAEPELSLLAFRLRPKGCNDEEELAKLNREFLRRINQSRDHYLTPTTSGGRFLLRVCILHFRSHASHVDNLASQIQSAAAALLSEDAASNGRKA